jgi:hypothetical protein
LTNAKRRRRRKRRRKRRPFLIHVNQRGLTFSRLPFIE